MMKKALIVAAIAALTTSTVYAADNAKCNCVKCKCHTEQAEQMPPKDFDMQKPPRKENFDKRLNLTEAQKAKVQKQREAARKKMEPIRNQIREKEQAKFEKIKEYEQTDAELIKLNNEIKALKCKEHKIMEENKKSFESVLTKSQKAELAKIKSERAKKGDCHKKCPPCHNFKHEK